MQEKLKVAVIGAGLFGQVHLEAYRQHPRVQLKRACDVNVKRAQEAAMELGLPVCTDYREVAEDETIDAVSVATPDFLHREIVVAMLQAGKHVLVEKPMATHLDDARAMVQAAREARKHLVVDFHNRWNPPVAHAKQRIAGGEFGRPVMASARLANTLRVPREMLSWAGQSGPQWFLFPHIVDMVCWLFDRHVRRVAAWGRKGVLQAMGVDAYDAVQALAEFEDCSATFETAWILPETFPQVVDFSATLFGTAERIGLAPTAPTLDISGMRHEWPVAGARQEIHGQATGWQLLPILHFADCLLKGRPPLVTPEEGFHNTAVICAMEQAIENGGWVEVARL